MYNGGVSWTDFKKRKGGSQNGKEQHIDEPARHYRSGRELRNSPGGRSGPSGLTETLTERRKTNEKLIESRGVCSDTREHRACAYVPAARALLGAISKKTF